MKHLVHDEFHDEFYVGYLPNAPRVLGKIVTRIAASILLAGTAVGALLIFNQPAFAPSRFEAGKYRDYEGVIEEWPYPILVADSASFLLVAPGKYGVTEAVRGLQGMSVRLKGSLVERARDRMLVVPPGSVVTDGSIVTDTARPLKLAPSITDLGPITLRGEIVDTKCYLGAMNPGESKVHRDCAVRCISGGVPPAFLARDVSGEVKILLLVGADGRALDKEVLRYVAEPLELSGYLLRAGSTLTLKADPTQFRRISEYDGQQKANQ
jgi:hypothetical protein